MNDVGEVMHHLRSEQVQRDCKSANERGGGDEEGFGCHGNKANELGLNRW